MLGKLADIINDDTLKQKGKIEKVKTLNPEQVPSYPYIPELQAIDNYGSILIHKGDIVTLDKDNYFVSA